MILTPPGEYLLALLVEGEKAGVYEVSLSERKCMPLLLGISTYGAIFASDGKSFLYPVASRGKSRLTVNLGETANSSVRPRLR